MHRKSLSTKVLSWLITAIIIISTVFAMGITASAASYPTITLNVPRISQRPNTGDCAIASISTVEAYMYGYPSGNYNSSVYQTVYAKNGYTISASWSKLGYESSGFSMERMYSQLQSGYPVIVHRTSSHYSVVYGYTGNASSLSLSGFLITDVDDSYTDSSSKKTLDRWVGGASLDQMVVRRNGVSIPQNSIKITCNHPPYSLIKGTAFGVYGNIVSRYNITSVQVSILASNGSYAQNSNYTSSPNSTTFGISNADSKMLFSKLSAGSYTYKVVAKDSSGASTNYSYSFKVVNSSSDVVTPPSAPVVPSTPTPGETKVSYNAKVTADPSLNIRSGADTSYSSLALIPKGTIVNVTAESNGWGKTTYSGKTGWVSLQYLSKVASYSASFYIRTSASASVTSDVHCSASSLTTVPANVILKITAKCDNFYKVTYNGKTGWISASKCVSNIGDINSDGKTNSADALIILQYVTNAVRLNATQIARADLDGNGKVNSADSLRLLQLVTGK